VASRHRHSEKKSPLSKAVLFISAIKRPFLLTVQQIRQVVKLSSTTIFFFGLQSGRPTRTRLRGGTENHPMAAALNLAFC